LAFFLILAEFGFLRFYTPVYARIPTPGVHPPVHLLDGHTTAMVGSVYHRSAWRMCTLSCQSVPRWVVSGDLIQLNDWTGTSLLSA